MSLPGGSHQRIDAIHEQQRLVLANIVRIEALPPDVGFAHGIVVIHDAVDATRMTKLEHRMVQPAKTR
jgi:hypothetical protein